MTLLAVLASIFFVGLGLMMFGEIVDLIFGNDILKDIGMILISGSAGIFVFALAIVMFIVAFLRNGIIGKNKEEVKKLLEGNFKKMEAEFNKIDVDTTKKFVLDVAREIKLESAAKQRFIKEWIGSGLTIEELFPVEE